MTVMEMLLSMYHYR